jgi:2-hydroxy-6-oxonona-2,4-dienedioate hydrolase
LNIPGLARDFRVYALDKLGQGYTDNPPRDEAYTFEAVVSHVAGFLRTLGIRGAHIVGHSRGALAAALIALEDPDLVSSLTFADSNSLAPVDAIVPYDFYSRMERVPPGGEPTRASVRAEPEANSYSTEHVSEDWLDRIHAFARLDKVRAAAARVAELRRSVWQPSVERCREMALRRIDTEGLPVPTQVIWGVQDPSAPLPLAHLLFTRICGLTRHAELHVINRAGHYAFREHAGTFNRLVTGFCRAVG